MTERPHRRAAAAKSTIALTRKVNTELFEYPGGNRPKPGNHQVMVVKRSRWDPYERFTRKEDLTKFFSGHEYRRFYLPDREDFAKYVIEQVLKDHPEDNYETAGEIMKHQSIVDQSDESGSLEDLARAIRAEVQQDVDAEIPRDITPRASKADENESTQKISSAAQSIIAASPNSLGPPIEPCASYLNMTRCGHFGRSNSTVWKSPLFPKLDNQEGRRGLLDHQVTAIVWLLSRMFGDLPTLKIKNPVTGVYRSNILTPSDEKNRERLKGPKYFGGILADSMGLGKTLTTVALIDLMMRQRLNVVQAEDGSSKHRPILLLTPNATVANQWVQELTQVIDVSTLPRIIVSGNGLESPCDPLRAFHLSRDSFNRWPATFSYMWDENNPRASRVVLIMTMESWALRTCTRNDEGEWSSSFTKEGRAFSLVIVDEAYKVKNSSTKNWRSVHLLERQFTLLITATPCMNSLADLFGLARLLWNAPERYLKQSDEKWKQIEQMFPSLKYLDRLDGFSPSHDFWLVAGRPSLLAKLLLKRRNANTQDIDLIRKYLKYFESLAMLKRSPTSYLYADWEKTEPISLEGLFPKAENYTVDISLDEAYDREYQAEHMELLVKYLEGLRHWGGGRGRGRKSKKEEEDAKDPIMNSIRLLQIASSSLDVYDLDTIITANGHSTLAEKIAEMREKEVNLLRLAQFLVLPNEAKPETHVDWMKLATRNSPILRYILRYINENILTRQGKEPIKKLLIIEHNLMLAFYYELVLQFLGFECRCMHAHLSFDERQALVDSFNMNDNDSCQIMIQLYTVGFAGTNLHKSCSRVLVASQSHSLQVQWQAIYRVIRVSLFRHCHFYDFRKQYANQPQVGQTSDVTVHRVKVKNSYHTFRESRQIEKILPELGSRAQGNTKKTLVRLLNLFQYEVNKAWYSAEGTKLRQEMNLLGDVDAQKATPGASKKRKLSNSFEAGVKVEKRIKLEDEKIKSESGSENDETQFSDGLLVSSSTTPTKQKQASIASKAGDGGGGWYNKLEGVTDIQAFLDIRKRDDYYKEFIKLPRAAKSQFSHVKNNLRRLLSYGNDNGKLSKLPWKEVDLENPAILERALELMLRVHLGARDIAMLPFPLIDLSKAPAARRVQLQDLLEHAKHTDQDLDKAGGSSSAVEKDLREVLRGTNVKLPLGQIDRDLEVQARFSDASTTGVKKESRSPRKIKQEELEEESEGEKSETAKGKEVIVIDDDDDDDDDELLVFDF
ncbi:P-loop containing nucleoside triphosphate hydrolase protein [Nemania sp. FL0031]|nr:P-loop containing nucleoside triphosphate hydrolase protein [Nemania sp. FL0031]